MLILASTSCPALVSALCLNFDVLYHILRIAAEALDSELSSLTFVAIPQSNAAAIMNRKQVEVFGAPVNILAIDLPIVARPSIAFGIETEPTAPAASLAFSNSFWFARRLFLNAVREGAARHRMALVSSIGGGWASVRNAEGSMKYASELHELACSIGDDSNARKARLFLAWSAMYEGDSSKAEAIIASEEQEAKLAGDEVHWHRCSAATRHLKQDPVFAHCRNESGS